MNRRRAWENYKVMVQRAERWHKAAAGRGVAAMATINAQKNFEHRFALMDIAEGTVRVIPREEVLERLLERGKA